MKKPRTYQIRATVSFAIEEERKFIEEAVTKVNKGAENGEVVALSAFMKNAALEKAEKVLGVKRPAPK